MRVGALISDIVTELMAFHHFATLNEPQRLAFEKMSDSGKSFVVAANTASGKTFIAEVAAINSIRNGKKAVYLAPLKALATEKFEDFSDHKEVSVELRTGDYDRDEKDLADADFIIATYPKFDSIIRHNPEWLGRVGLVIADEGHEITDAENGSTIEILLTRLRQMGIGVMVLSAVMPNVEAVASWLGADHVKSDWRPVPLGKGVMSGRRIDFTDGTTKKISVSTDNSVCDLALDTVEGGGQALVFARSRKEAVSYAEKIGLRLSQSLLLQGSQRNELEKLARSVSKMGSDLETSKRLAGCIKGGAAFHHAGVARELRKAVEDNYKSHLIKVISATPTLAAGINTPARRVIVQSISRWTAEGWGTMPRWEAENMFGRAGRPGFDTYGEAVLVETNYTSRNELMAYLRKPLEDIDSKLTQVRPFYSHVLSEICLSTSATVKSLTDLFSKTFYASQPEGKVTIRRYLTEALDFLVRYGLVRKVGKEVVPSDIGRRLVHLYITPLSFPLLKNALQKDQTNLGYLHMVTSMDDWRSRPPDVEDAGWDELRREFGGKGVEVDDKDEQGEPIRVVEAGSAYMLAGWIEEKPTAWFSQFELGEGDLNTMRDTAEWLLYAAKELAFMTRRFDAAKKLDVLNRRMKKGIKEELFDICSIKGIGRVKGRRLFNQGIKTAVQYRQKKNGMNRLDSYLAGKQ